MKGLLRLGVCSTLLIVGGACAGGNDHVSASEVIERFQQEGLAVQALTADLGQSDIVEPQQLHACDTGRAFGEPIERGGYPLYFRVAVVQCPDNASAEGLAATMGPGPNSYLRANRVVVHKNIVLVIQQDAHLWSITEPYVDVLEEM